MPSATELVWPIAQSGITVSWDPDSTRLGQGPRRSAAYFQVHIPYEPLTTPRIAEDEEGIRYPVASDLQPRLAVAWEPADDYRVWTVHLRRGVRSNWGNELNAECVRWSWERVYHLKQVGYWRSCYLAGLASIDDLEILDDYTLRFHLSRSNPAFPQYLIFATNNIVDATEAKRHATPDDPWAVAWLSDHPAGFGPFTLDHQTPTSLHFRSRDDFWAGRPPLTRITQLGVSTREQAFRLLERGEANFLLGLYPDEYPRFLHRPGYRLIRTRANHATLEFNWLAPPFDDQRVRQAICYALPYARIWQDVYHGYARPSYSPIPSVSACSTAEFWPYTTDLERARALLAASAYPAGFEVPLYIQPSAESLRFGEVVRESLLALGIRVEVRVQTSLPVGTKVPLWFKEECGHALYEPLYDLAHDYDPPPGMWGGKNIVAAQWQERLRAVREAPSWTQAEGYRALQRELLEFAPCAHIAEIETGWVVREPVTEWVLGPWFLGAQTCVWSTHRQMLGGWW